MAFVYWIKAPHHTDMFSEGYIGFTSTTVENRYKEHKAKAKNTASNLKLHNALRKYEKDVSIVTILEGTNEYCLEVEKKLRSRENIGWNIAVGGEAPMLGRKHTEENRKKQSLAQIGKIHSDATRLKMSASQKEVGMTPAKAEALKKARAVMKGRPVSVETRKKLSAAMMGREISIESRKKLSEIKKGKPPSEITLKASAEYNRNLKAWETNPAKRNSENWSKALEMFDYLQINPTHGIVKLSRAFNTTKGKARGVHWKILDGWVPSKDEDYLTWLSNYKEKQKECQNVT